MHGEPALRHEALATIYTRFGTCFLLTSHSNKLTTKFCYLLATIQQRNLPINYQRATTKQQNNLTKIIQINIIKALTTKLDYLLALI